MFSDYESFEDQSLGSPHSAEMGSPGLPVPTVVAELGSPYEQISTEGPHIMIVEQPQSKFRFRYKSEMAGTHGQLKAERADKNKAIYPTVKLMNWSDGPALIRLALFTTEPNPNHRRRHVHELHGKNCEKETGLCEAVVDHTTDYTLSLQNIGIVHIARREVKEIIRQRKRSELIEHAKLRRPQSSYEEIRQSITPTDMKKFDEEAEEIAKKMDLNKVVLRFQAFQYDTNLSCYRPITRWVDSELVTNLKNASTGELKIVRMSECSGPCTGGTEVWMLVEKVKKNNIKVKFFELGMDGDEVWSAYGDFSDCDVHHQYSIIFRTPPYRITNLRSSVRVKVQLERPTDKDTSEPRDYTYYPESRKRASPYSDYSVIEHDEEYAMGGGGRIKRHCHDPPQPINLTKIGTGRTPSDSDTLEAISFSIINGEEGSGNSIQSSPYTTPSPNYPGESPNSNSNFSIYSPASVGGDSLSVEAAPFIQVNDRQIQHIGNTFMFTLSPADSSSPQLQSSTSPNYQVSSPAQQVVYLQSPSPTYQQSPSPGYQQFAAPVGDRLVPTSPQQPGNETLICHLSQQPIQQHQQVLIQPQFHQQVQQPQEVTLQTLQQQPQQQQQSCHHLETVLPLQIEQPQQPLQGISLNTPTLPAQSSTPNDEFWDWSNLGLEQGSNFDLVDSINLETINPDIFGTSDLQTDSVTVKKRGTKPTKVSVDDLTDSLASVKLSEHDTKVNCSLENESKPVQKMKEKHIVAEKVDVAFRVAISAAESLQAYAATGDMGRLLATHRYLLAVQNNQGDNALHTAVSCKNWEVFNKILQAAKSLRPEDLLNIQNFAGETALHLAVRGQNVAVTARLVTTPGCDISIPDFNGDTPLHVAAAIPTPLGSELVATLMRKPVNGRRSSLEAATHAFNYKGETALHVATMSGNLDTMRLLVEGGADVHACDSRRGANCLHLAARQKFKHIASFLVKHTDIAVNARMFDGNSALHLAALTGDAELCQMLIRAGADPDAKNSLTIPRRRQQSGEEKLDDERTDDEEDEQDDDEEEEPKCYTPADYASNVEVLRVLLGHTTDVIDSKDNVAMDSGIDVSATDLNFTAVV